MTHLDSRSKFFLYGLILTGEQINNLCYGVLWSSKHCSLCNQRICKWQIEVDLCGGQDDTSVCWRWNLSCWWRLSGHHTNDGRKKCPIAGDWQLPFHQSYLWATADSSHFFLSFFLESWLLTTAWSCPSFIRFSFVFVFFCILNHIRGPRCRYRLS